MVANSAAATRMAVEQTAPEGDPEKVNVSELFDRMKALHSDDVIPAASAEILMSLTDGVIRGARSRSASRWSQVLGPVVKPGTASELLGISSTALDKKRKTGAVLGVRTDNGRWVYPLAQFRATTSGSVAVLPGLREVLSELLAAADGLAAARWLATPNRRLGASTPWEALDDLGNLQRVVDAACAQAAAWAGR